MRIKLHSVKPVFHFNRMVANRMVAKRTLRSIVFISFVMLDCSRNNEIRYVSLRYG